MKPHPITLCSAFLIVLLSSLPALASITYYVDGNTGSDAADGLSWNTETAEWFPVSDETAADSLCLGSGSTASGETTAIEATVKGAGSLSFMWRISSNRGHYARFYVDGEKLLEITRITDWANVEIPLGDGSHTVRWTYEKGTGATAGEDAAYLDDVVWAPITLKEALDAPILEWTTTDGAEWIPQIATTFDGVSAVRSGSVWGEATSRLSTTLPGPGTLAWKWKAEIEGNAGVDIMIDDVWTDDVYLAGSCAWTDETLTIDEAGPHVLTFEFWNGGTEATIGDCAFIDGVSWTPAYVLKEGIIIPYSWIRLNAPTIVSELGGDCEAAANAVASNGLNRVWQCYVAGLDPEDIDSRFLALVDWIDNEPVVSWTPDLGGDRDYIVEGKADLSDEWGVADGSSRFFRVKVSFPGMIKRSTISFDTAGGTEVAPITGEVDVRVSPPPSPVRTGYAFSGWDMNFPENMPTGSVTLVAQWTPNQYEVRFNANGGTGAMPSQTFVYDAEQALSPNGFSRANRFFSGWATEPDGSVVFGNGEVVLNLSSENEAVVELYAVWSETAPGLAVRYYEVATSGYDTWSRSSDAMIGYFAGLPATLETNSLDWGEMLEPGFTSANEGNLSNWSSAGLATPGTICHFHGEYSAASAKDNFAVFATGLLWIDEAGNYQFGAVADDNVAICVDGQTVVVNHDSWTSPAFGSIHLDAGMHTFMIGYYENTGNQGLTVQWKKPGDGSFAPIPQSVLFHRTGSDTIVFHANGGEGEMPEFLVNRNFGASLPSCGFSKTNHLFVGWAIEPDGAAIYANGGSVANLTTDSDGAVELHAVWRETSPGLEIRYYDTETDGYETWIQSESAMLAFFANMTPTMTTNTLALGATLVTGFSDPQTQKDTFTNAGLTDYDDSGCRFHDLYGNRDTNYFAALMNGFLNVEEPGTYTFAVMADDRIVLYIDGVKVANGTWVTGSMVGTGSMYMNKGAHSIRVGYWEYYGGQGFTVQWKKPGDASYSPMPQSVLLH